jgi:hypothetical protein
VEDRLKSGAGGWGVGVYTECDVGALGCVRMEIRTRDGIKGGPVRYGERGEWVAAGCRCRCGVQDVKTFK